MFRHAFAGVLAIALTPGALGAQTRLTIEASSTDVHEFPKIGARVVGQAQRGRVLEVTGEDGDWVRVVWPEAAACVGYVRLRVGVLDNRDRVGEGMATDVRADVDAVERAVWTIWEAQSEAATPLHGEPRR